MTQRVVNYTYGTGNPVLPDGSIDVRDGIDNLQSFDIFMNASEDTYNQRDGEIVRTVSGMNNEFDTMIGGMNNEFDTQILNMGFTRVGTFAAGATLTNPRQTLLWDIADGGDGQEYGWSGAFPKVVPATSTPASTGGISVGAWISRFDPALRVQVREALSRSYAESGRNLVDGSFEAGGTLANANDVLLHEASGKAYAWHGTYPLGEYIVPPGSTPAEASWFDASPLEPGAGTVRDGRFALRDWVSVMDFGAKGDGVSDDRPALQKAVDYCFSIGGGTVFFPKPVAYYALKSTHPTRTTSCLVMPAPLNSRGDVISLEGVSPLVQIYTETAADIHSTLYFEGTSGYRRIENLSLNGGTFAGVAKADYVLYGADNFHPYMSVAAARFYTAKVACLWLSTFVSTMTKVQTAFAPIGFKFSAPGMVDAPVTSITFNSCYALNHTQNGYHLDQATYCTFNSCAADNITGYAYNINIARGVAFNGCGAESSDRILNIGAAQGVTINGIMTLGIGNNTTPPAYLINIGGGTNVTIAGVHLHNSKAYTKILRVGSTIGNEVVSILDDCITIDQCTWTAPFNREIPINFLISSKTHKDWTYNVASEAELIALMAKEFGRYKEIRHAITIKFPSGDIPITSITRLFGDRITGCGSITLEGATATRLVVSGAGRLDFMGAPTTLPIILKNITLHMNAISGGQGVAIYSKSFRLTSSSGITSHNGAVQYGLFNGANVYVDSSSLVNTAAFVESEVTFTLAKGTSAPASGSYPVGAIKYASNPDATRIGWICTKANSSTFVPF